MIIRKSTTVTCHCVPSSLETSLQIESTRLLIYLILQWIISLPFSLFPSLTTTPWLGHFHLEVSNCSLTGKDEGHFTSSFFRIKTMRETIQYIVIHSSSLLHWFCNTPYFNLITAFHSYLLFSIDKFNNKKSNNHTSITTECSTPMSRPSFVSSHFNSFSKRRKENKEF